MANINILAIIITGTLGITLLFNQVYTLPTSRVDLVDKNCTDCCSYLRCVQQFITTESNTSTQNRLDDIFCSGIENQEMSVCYTPDKLKNCSMIQQLLPVFPSAEANIHSNIKLVCAHKDDYIGLQNCMENQNVIANSDICNGPYLSSLRDPSIDACLAYKTQINCTVNLLQKSQCPPRSVNAYELIQKETLEQTCNLLHYIQSLAG